MDSAQMTKIAHALSDPTRLQIFEAIASVEEMNCSEIICRQEIAPGTVSHHLKTLAEAGLIDTRREGQFIYNRAIPETLQQYTKALARLAVPAKTRRRKS
jgi:ArsR family transcriptional regulator